MRQMTMLDRQMTIFEEIEHQKRQEDAAAMAAAGPDLVTISGSLPKVRKLTINPRATIKDLHRVTIVALACLRGGHLINVTRAVKDGGKVKGNVWFHPCDLPTQALAVKWLESALMGSIFGEVNPERGPEGLDVLG